MKRPYIAGPIAGASWLPFEEKVERFYRADAVLRSRGYFPVNPMDVDACPSEDCNPKAVGENRIRTDGKYRHSWDCWMRYDLIALLTYGDGLALLPEWTTSAGAQLERHIALGLDWEIIDLSQDPVVLDS